MISLMILLIILMTFSSSLLMLNILMSKKSSLYNREKMSPFECGFDPASTNRLPFSIQFFLISLIFMIFDIEISLLIPIIIIVKIKISIEMIIISIMFLWILTIGLFIEYSEKSIDWKI